MIASLGQNLVKSATGAAQNVAAGAVGELQNVANSAVQNVANSAVQNVAAGAVGELQNAATNAVGNVLNGATNAAGNVLNGATSAIPGIDQNLATGAMGSLASGAMGSLASGAIGQSLASEPASEPASAPAPPPLPTTDTSSLPQALKSAIVQLLTTINDDQEFKQMIADQSISNVYSAIDEKCGKVAQKISNLQNLQKTLEQNGSTDYETLKQAVAKYNQDFNLILEGQKAITGGSKRRQITRRKSSSRAFRKTRGRRQSSR